MFDCKIKTIYLHVCLNMWNKQCTYNADLDIKKSKFRKCLFQWVFGISKTGLSAWSSNYLMTYHYSYKTVTGNTLLLCFTNMGTNCFLFLTGSIHLFAMPIRRFFTATTHSLLQLNINISCMCGKAARIQKLNLLTAHRQFSCHIQLLLKITN